MSPDLVAAKLSELAERVRRVRLHCPDTVGALQQDPDRLDLVSFNLMLAVQAAADLAGRILSDAGGPAPSTLREGFERLGELEVISPETATALRRAVGLRNIVAHGYGGVDVDAIFAAASKGVEDLDRFAREIATWVTRL